MEIFSPSKPSAVGAVVAGGTENSILFVGAGGVLSQDNANFSRTAAQFKYKTVTEHSTNGAVRFEFDGNAGGGYTNGLVIAITGSSGYFGTHLVLSNAAYATAGYMAVSNANGIDFRGVNESRWDFNTASISGGISRIVLRSSTAAISGEGVVGIVTGYAAQVGLKMALAASQSADAVQIFASDGTTKLLSIGATGFIETIEQTAPSAPAANGVRIYAVDNGAGKTQLMALFSSGAAQQIAIEP